MYIREMNKAEKRVLVGMSGGIDSTATCLMLQEQGYEVIGLTMWVWGEEPLEARQLAQNMGIEHYVADEREALREVIVQNFIDEYRAYPQSLCDVQSSVQVPHSNGVGG